MSVYFVRAGKAGPVKIGTADDVPSRMREIQVGNHEELILLRVINGDGATERWLHAHYRSRHVRGEWFLFCQTMLTIEPSPQKILVWPEWPIIDSLAAEQGVLQQARRRWFDRGRVAYRWHIPLLKEAGKRGHVLTPQSFFAQVAE